MCLCIKLRSLAIWHDHDFAAFDLHAVIDHKAPHVHGLRTFDLAVALEADSDIYDVLELEDIHHCQFVYARDHVVVWTTDDG